MKNIYKLFVALLILSAGISCSKDDNPENPPVNSNGGEIFTSQVVTVNLPGVNLTMNEYQGSLAGTPVRLIKSGESKLLFVVPAGQTGAGDLIIPTLDVTVNYTTTATVLEGTPDEVIADFNTNLTAFEATLDNSPEALSMMTTINSFNTYYANAGTEQKTQIAIVYQANKAAFDMILLSDNAGRVIVAGTEIHITKHVAAVALIGVGVAALAASPVLAAVIVSAAAIKAYQANTEAVNHVFSTVAMKVAGWFGNNNRNTNFNGVTLRNDELEEVTFSLQERNITAADAAKTDPLAVQYFNAVEQYNYYAAEGNEAIDTTNTDEGTNYSDIPETELPATGEEFSTDVNSEIMGNIQFSINDPNLMLVSASVENEGMLKIRVKVLGTPSSWPVESQLTYSYSDGFSSFNGNLPIQVVNEIDLSGTWSMAITLGSGVCDEILVLDEVGGALNFLFNDNNSLTFQNDPSSVGLNGSSFVQTYALDGQTLSITVTSEDGSFQIETDNYNPVTNTFTGTYTNQWAGDTEQCSNTVVLTKLN